MGKRPVMRVHWLVAFILVTSLPMSSADLSGRAVSVEIDLDEKIWLSSDNIVIEVNINGAPFNKDISLSWELMDSEGNLTGGTSTFQMSSSNHVEQIEVANFYRGNHFIDFQVSISFDSTMADNSIGFIVLSDVVLPANIDDILVFGDSLSDMGNGKDSWLDVPDVPPYWNGRFSNGPIWIDHVSSEMSVNLGHGSGSASGGNRAFGGAQTGQGYAYLVLPNVGAQISEFLTQVQGNISSNQLVIVWAGGNDFLYGTGNPDVISQNMASHVRELALAGGSEFVVVNLPPIELTPEGKSKTSSQQAQMTQDVQSYNSKLATEMTNLSNTMSLNITLVDAWSMFYKILANPSHVGLTNIQDPACSGAGGLLPLPICNDGDTVASNADEYLFFDKAHPTATMHEVIGAFALEYIGENDSDGDGIIDLIDNCEWSSGQVDVNGCDWAQQDEDLDGVANGLDDCLETISGFEVDSNGCAAYQRDSDEDGLTDDVDPCPNDVQGTDHDSDGCIDLVDADDDNDGLADEEDNCPKGLIGISDSDFDQDGCDDSEDLDDDGDGLSDEDEILCGCDPFDVDSDDDGVWDGEDAFPLDSSEWVDSDLDGVGDNSDNFPFDSSEWVDSDMDSVGDNSDSFPTDHTEWDDSDGDGFGDNSDACPEDFGTSIEPMGCYDSDGDGFSDQNDAFPHDQDDWLDSDGDGHGDNNDLFPMDSSDWLDSDIDGYGDNRDFFPSDEGEWNDSDLDGCGDNSDAFPFDGTECFDSDKDGVGDNSDPWPNDPSEWLDSDKDGVGDNSDFAPNDATEHKDSDGDGIGDNADLWPNDKGRSIDSDGDGVANSVDAFPNNSEMDSWFSVILGFGFLIILCLGTIYFISNKQKQKQSIEETWTSEVPLEAPSLDDFD